MRSLLKQTWDWTMKWSKSRYSILALFLFMFIDASVFPLPTTVIFITVSLLHPFRINYNALIATLGMVGGAALGYGIGHYLWINPDGGFTGLAQYFFGHVPGFTLDFYNYSRELYIKWSYGILFLSIILPIPYQVYSITAGAFDVNLLGLLLCTIIFQGFRYYLLAQLVIKFREGVEAIFQKNLKIVALTTIVLLLAYIVVTKVI
jgi:membrane protein YqaA with SNARE-associated domain